MKIWRCCCCGQICENPVFFSYEEFEEGMAYCNECSKDRERFEEEEKKRFK